MTNKREEAGNPLLSGRSTRRQFIGRSAGVALSIGSSSAFLAACGGSDSSGGELRVLSWISYQDPTVKKLFAKAYPDIKLRSTISDSDQAMFTKAKAGGAAQFDIVFGNAGWSPTYLKNDIIEPIDLNGIKAADQLYPIFRDDTKLPYVEDGGKVLLYPNMWSSLTMTWNTTVPFQPSEPYSWSALWDPAIPENHVQLQGGGDDFIAMTGLEQGVPPDKIYAMNGADLQRVEDRLKELKPFQLNPNVLPEFRAAIRTKKAWIGLTSDYSAAPLINQQAGEPVAKSVVPKEGTTGWVDGPHLIKGAKNKANAMKFINWFASDPELLHYLWDQYRFAQCNKSAVEREMSSDAKTAAFIRGIQGDKPQLAKQILFSRPADDPAAWAATMDRVVGA